MFAEIILFFVIALVYSSAGFGGGSMYIVVLSQAVQDHVLVRFTALLCNATVTTAGTIEFFRNGWLAVKPVSLLLSCSVPFCVLSSTWKLESQLYFILLGCCLLVSAVAMLIQKQSSAGIDEKISNWWWHYLASAVIGFIAGLTGIGGGVYLAPLLHLSRWGSPKHIAAASSMFILVNSVVSLVTRTITHDAAFEAFQAWLVLAVITGGFIGSRMTSNIFSQRAVRYITIAIIIFGSVKVLWERL